MKNNLMPLVAKKGQRAGRIAVSDVSQDHRAFRTVAGNQESELEQDPHHQSGSRARVHDRRQKRTREIDDALARLGAVVIAIILTGSMDLWVRSSWSQDLPRSRQPGGAIPEKPKAGQLSAPQQGVAPHGMAGMSEEKIKRVEEALQERGHDPGRIDGIVDERTRNALREFQKLNNLAVTGALDEQTAAKLGVQLEGGTPPPMRKEAPGLRGSSPGSQRQASLVQDIR